MKLKKNDEVNVKTFKPRKPRKIYLLKLQKLSKDKFWKKISQKNIEDRKSLQVQRSRDENCINLPRNYVKRARAEIYKTLREITH